MSRVDPGDDGDSDGLSPEEEFRKRIRETFAPHEKSLQYRYDHPDGDLPREVSQDQPPQRDPHKDGNDIYKTFGMSKFGDFLERAVKGEHAVAKHPQALPHFLTHVEEWEKWEMGQPDPDFSDLQRNRQAVMEWYAGLDEATRKSTEFDKGEASSTRMKRLRPGGTGIVLHGEQGTTKTTAMYWLISRLMEINQDENVIWQSTLDDTEWQIFAPWATVCLPAGVDVDVLANPYHRDYRDLGAFSIEMADISREIIRYSSPDDLLETMAARKPGHIYVVYPDPKFRQCQALTGWSYENIWEVTSSDEATDLNHFWFALMEGLHGMPEYNYWTTLVGDEAHKWLRQGKGNDEHDWWNKIEDWATYWGDARKERLSVILAIHKWHRLHSFVRDKIRWAATMNGEDFPPAAPLDGKNDFDQDLGDMCVWNNTKWNHVGYPNIKRDFSVGADIEVAYPGFETEIHRKS